MGHEREPASPTRCLPGVHVKSTSPRRWRQLAKTCFPLGCGIVRLVVQFGEPDCVWRVADIASGEVWCPVGPPDRTTFPQRTLRLLDLRSRRLACGHVPIAHGRSLLPAGRHQTLHEHGSFIRVEVRIRAPPQPTSHDEISPIRRYGMMHRAMLFLARSPSVAVCADEVAVSTAWFQFGRHVTEHDSCSVAVPTRSVSPNRFPLLGPHSGSVSR